MSFSKRRGRCQSDVLWGCGPSWLEIQSVDLVGAGARAVADNSVSIYGVRTKPVAAVVCATSEEMMLV
jgi:hypothetical protein